MIRPVHDFREFIRSGQPAVLVETMETAGSTPRETGSWMVVGGSGFAGTIGGGSLEFRAMDEAMRMLRDGRKESELAVTLGPDTGQCCGGTVRLHFERLDEKLRAELISRMDAEDERRPHALVFGAGHVGFALAESLARLPLNVSLVDSRPEALEICPPRVHCRLLAVPEQAVRDAPGDSAFAVMTHDHGQDFLIASEALRRGDASYVGLIGSKSKRARFAREFKENGGTQEQLARLVSPIGGKSSKEKRPEIIAAFAAAEIASALFSPGQEMKRQKRKGRTA